MRSALRPLLFAAVVVLGFVLRERLHLSAAALIEHTRAFVAARGAYAPLVFIGLCGAGMLLHAPTLLFIAAGGLAFGTLGGLVYGWIGAMLGAISSFLLARYLLRDLTQRTLLARSPRLRALDERLAGNGFVTVVTLRLVFFLAPPLNWAIGATRVGFPQYVAGSALGALPGIALTVYFADRVAALRSWTQLLTTQTALPALMLLGLVAVSAVAINRWLHPDSPPP